MARIADYIAPERQLRPSEAGFAAYETAGRRIGPLYREIATGIAEQGKLKAQEMVDAGRWPFAILDLQRRTAEQVAQTNAAAAKAAAAAGGGGVNFRLREGRSDGARYPSDYRAMNEISQAAPVMSSIARGLIYDPSSPGPLPYKTDYGLGGDTFTLQNGQFVSTRSKQYQADWANPNQTALDQAQKWYNQQDPNMPNWNPTPSIPTSPVGEFSPRADTPPSDTSGGIIGTIGDAIAGLANWATGSSASTPDNSEGTVDFATGTVEY